MNRQEMKAAMAQAQSPQAEFDHVALAIFEGFGLPDFRPVHVTTYAVGQLIRWQARRFDGQFDPTALQEIAQLGRQRFLIIG
jgi:hypothetical protein